MNFLKDTCVLIKKINCGTEILNVVNHCKDNGDKFCITDVVFEELNPGGSVKKEDAERSIDIIKALEISMKAKLVKKIDVKVHEKYKNNFDRIRARYYDHLLDSSTIKEKLQAGEITKEQVKNKSYLRKDYGECSCIAVAMESPEEYVIVSNDKGRIFLKDDINLFNIYRDSHNIKVWDFNQWIGKTNYSDENKKIKTS